jgi:hypothetical protein
MVRDILVMESVVVSPSPTTVYCTIRDESSFILKKAVLARVKFGNGRFHALCIVTPLHSFLVAKAVFTFIYLFSSDLPCDLQPLLF